MIDKNFTALIGERNRIENILKTDRTLSQPDRVQLTEILGSLESILHRHGYHEGIEVNLDD